MNMANAGTAEAEAAQDIIDKGRKFLGGGVISLPQRHSEEFKRAKWGDNGRFWDVFGRDWSLVVCTYQVVGRENLHPVRRRATAMDVW